MVVSPVVEKEIREWRRACREMVMDIVCGLLYGFILVVPKVYNEHSYIVRVQIRRFLVPSNYNLVGSV